MRGCGEPRGFHLTLARQRYSALAAEQVLVRVRDVIGRRGQRVDELERRLENLGDAQSARVQ